MKYVVTTMDTGDTKQVINQQMLPAETDSIKHELIELEPLEKKAGFTQEIVFDGKTYKLEYKAIPKSKIEQLEDLVYELVGSSLEEGGGADAQQ